MLITNLHFIRPQALLLILPLAVMVWFLVRRHESQHNWHRVCDAHLLPHLLVGNQNQRRYLPLVLLSLSWLIACIALAGPSWSQLPQTLYQSAIARVIVLDQSLYMVAKDIKPSRNQRANYKVQDILHRTQEGQVGLIAFAAEPYVVAPLTDDTHTIAAMMPELNPSIMPVQGSNIGHALVKAQTLLRQANTKSGEIILITGSPVDEKDLAIAQSLRYSGYPVSVLGVGTSVGSPISDSQGHFLKDRDGNIVVTKLDHEGLRQLANAGGGRYQDFRDDDQDIATLMATANPHHKDHAITTKHQLTNQWQDQGRYFVLLLLPLALVSFRRGWLGGPS